MDKLLKFEYFAMLGFAVSAFLKVQIGNIFLGIATALFLYYIYKNKVDLPKESKGYCYAILFFVATMFLSAVFSGDIGIGLNKWINMWVYRFMPFFIIIVCLKDSLKAKRILSASFIGLTIAILYFMYQWYCGIYRPKVFFNHPIVFSGLLVIYLPVLLTIALDKIFENKYRVVSGLIFVAGLACSIYSGTRGAWIALFPVLLGIVVYYGLKDKKILAVALAVLLVGGIGLSTYQPFMKRFNTITNNKYQSNSERILMWNSAWTAFKDHPVLGVGLGQYKEAYQKHYISPKAKERHQQHAHNNFLQMLAENGLVGFVGFVVMMGYILFDSFKKFLYSKDIYNLMIFSVTSSLVLYGLTDYTFNNPTLVKLYWMVMGCLIMLSRVVMDSGEQ